MSDSFDSCLSRYFASYVLSYFWPEAELELSVRSHVTAMEYGPGNTHTVWVYVCSETGNDFQ